jgi:hypothetical protein
MANPCDAEGKLMSGRRILFSVTVAVLLAPSGSGQDSIRLFWEKAKDSDTDRFCVAVLSECLGLIDEKGNVIVRFDKPRWDMRDFSEGLMPISDPVSGKKGYIDKDGKWEIPPRFHYAGDFAEGYAIVLTGLKEPERFIDRLGNFVGPEIDYVMGGFRLGKAPVRKAADELAGYIDPSGEWAIFPRFQVAHSFSSEGLAEVRSTNGLWGYIDTSGAYRIQPRFVMTKSFQNGRAAVIEKGPCWYWMGELYLGAGFRELLPNGDINYVKEQPIGIDSCEWGLIDTYGQPVSDLRFQQVGEMTADGAPAKYAERWGLIGLDGQWISPPTWDKVGPFSEGMAAVREYPHGWGYVDRLGIVVIAPQYLGASEFSEGLAAVRVGPGETIYIRPDGSRAFDRSFEHGGPFRRGLANVMVREYDTWEYIDTQGRTVFRYTRPGIK